MISLALILVVISLKCSFACNGTATVCSSPVTFEDRRSDKNTLSIATFNAEWLFRDDGNNGPSRFCPEDHSNSSSCPWANKTQADAHLKVIANRLIQLNTDIITLIEVQDCVVLQCLINSMSDYSYKPYLIKGKDTGTDQNVAILSRIDPIGPLTRNELRITINTSDSSCGSLPDPSYESGVSKHFIARFNIPNLGNITLIGAHFVAFPTRVDRCIQREAQSSVIRDIAQLERDSGRLVIILGDLNDYDRDIPDASNSVPTSRVSNILKYNNTKKIMYSVIEKIEQNSSRYSNWYDKNKDCKTQPGELTLIDHLLVSPELFQQIKSVNIYNTVTQECDTLESDHYPIKVEFNSQSKNSSQTFRIEMNSLFILLALISVFVMN